MHELAGNNTYILYIEGKQLLHYNNRKITVFRQIKGLCGTHITQLRTKILNYLHN